jgi:hypothetical protein
MGSIVNPQYQLMILNPEPSEGCAEHKDGTIVHVGIGYPHSQAMRKPSNSKPTPEDPCFYHFFAHKSWFRWNSGYQP